MYVEMVWMVFKLGSYQDSKVINKTRNNFLGFG